MKHTKQTTLFGCFAPADRVVYANPARPYEKFVNAFVAASSKSKKGAVDEANKAWPSYRDDRDKLTKFFDKPTGPTDKNGKPLDFGFRREVIDGEAPKGNEGVSRSAPSAMESLFINKALAVAINICLDTLFRDGNLPEPEIPEAFLRKLLMQVKNTTFVEFSFDDVIYNKLMELPWVLPLALFLPIYSSVIVKQKLTKLAGLFCITDLWMIPCQFLAVGENRAISSMSRTIYTQLSGSLRNMRLTISCRSWTSWSTPLSDLCTESRN